MKVLESIYVNKKLQHELSYFNEDKPPCHENLNIIVHKKKIKKRNKSKVYKCSQQPSIVFCLSTTSTSKKVKPAVRHTSMPELKKNIKAVKTVTRSFAEIHKKNAKPFHSKFTINLVSEQQCNKDVNPFYPSQTKWKIYRCQLSTTEESCCCSCNSDAMFEVMKSLYDCYKKKNCDNCNCILCSHLHREERRLGELRKSMGTILEGTPSAKKQKEKIKAAEKLLQDKTPAQKERIIRDLIKAEQPLPKGKTPSEKSLIKRIRTEVGLPQAPETAADKSKMKKAQAAGILTPLEGKTAEQKENILKAQAAMGIELPEGRTASEKALIDKIKTASGIPIGITPERMRKAKAAGLITPLEGKTPAQKENILRALAMDGLPLPEGQTPSERKLIDKIRADLGLPPEPKNKAMRDKYTNAANAGLLQPLEGKTPREKERILQGLADLGIPLPEGRSASEKSLIAKIQAKAGPPLDVLAPSDKMRRAKAAGLLTPLEGKTPEQKEKILRDLAMLGIPLPEGRTSSERNLIDKVRKDLGLPPEPKTKALKDKHLQAANVGLLMPLEGKTPAQKEKILQGLHDMGIPLPDGRTASEKSLIAKIRAGPAPSEKTRKAKAAGLLTPLTGKSPAEKEKILRGLAMSGIPLPEGKTASERKLLDKVRADVGLPPEPKTPEMRKKYEQAANAGLMQPLEGKSDKEKERILKGLQDMGIPLPEGRTPSEKALIAKIKGEPFMKKLAPSEKMRKAKAAGLTTPLEGKAPDEKEKILKGLAMSGIPLPEGKTPSEKKLINKVRADLGLPPEPTTPEMKAKYAKAADAGLMQPLEGKTRQQKEDILQGLHDMGIPLPEGRTASEKSLIAKVKAGPRALSVSEKKTQAKAAGILTPLSGKSPAEREKILRGLAMKGLPLPEGKTASERKLIDKVRAELGLPPEPKTPSMRDKHAKAADAGLLQPLEGKSDKDKERILKGLQDMGIPLPEGRTPSEKALIAKIKAEPFMKKLASSEKIRKPKAAGLTSPLEGKAPDEKEKKLKALAMSGIPLPEGKTPSEKKLINKVRADLGLPPEPTTPEMKAKYAKAADAGLMQPLEGKTRQQKEDILQGLHDMGIPLPEGRTASEKSLIAKVKARPRALSVSEKKRQAKAAGILTPLSGKSPAEREKILRGLAMKGLPLPEGKTASEKKLIDKVRAELGLPPEPKTPSMRDKHAKAADAGLLQPLEGKSDKDKERILKGLQDMGIPLPEGRTPSEKALIAKIKAEPFMKKLASSEKIRRPKAAGLTTPLEGKAPDEKEKKLKALAMSGIPLPEGKTPSEKKLINKVRADLGLPPEPTTPEMKAKYAKAADAGLMQPLEGKTRQQKEDILQGLHDMGIPLPEGRTASEKSLIAKVKARPRALSVSEKKRQAKAAGILTPLSGKSPAEREKILRGLAMKGLPLPEGKTASEKKLIDKVRAELGLPPEPKTPSMRDKHAKAADAGLLQPLEGKSDKDKERILKGLQDMGIPLPEGRTPSEKALIAKIKAEPFMKKLASSEKIRIPKAAGLTSPLEGKAPDEKEKKLKALAMSGIPLPEGKTPSEKKLINKVRADLGLPPEPTTPEMKAKYAKAADAGLMQPLEGKTRQQKEDILQGLHDMGIPLPEGRTASEKSLIAKVKARPRALSVSEKKRQAKAAGILTPLSGKSPAEREKILRGLAMKGLPLPEGKTASEKKLIDKVRAELGLPPEPKTPSMRDKHAKAADAGLLQPLEGKSDKEKERLLQGLHDMGIPLPEGRTPSEKALIGKIKTGPRAISTKPSPSEKGKTPAQKEKILKGLAMSGLPLPEGKTLSEKKLNDKIRNELGLPPEPTSASMRDKYAKAAEAGLLQPLEGKTPKEKDRILKGLADMGIPLPEGRTPSEKALISKVRSKVAESITTDKMKKVKAAGLLTPLSGKTPEQREKILRGLAKAGLPLPEGKSPSEKALIRKVKKDFGIPDSTPSEKLRKAKAAGLLTPLEGKTPSQREKILRGRAAAGLPLPIGKTPSERALRQKIKEDTGHVTPSPSVRLQRAKAAGILTPLKGKSPSVKEKILKDMLAAGVPIPEGETPSEKEMIKRLTAEIPVTPSLKQKRAKAEAGLLTPLQGKTPEQKRKILKALVKAGIPLPEPKTASERDLIEKVRAEEGLPPEPKTPSLREKYRKAQAAGIITPLEGKSPAEKEKILKRLHEAGIPLPEGRTPSEKDMVKRIMASLPAGKAPSEKMKSAKAAGLLTPLEGKTPAQKEKILRGLVKAGIPLPEGKTPSEKDLIKKIRKALGLPPEPKSPSLREKMRKAHAAGIITPLEGKSAAQKEKILKAMDEAGIPLPEGRTASEKALIDKLKAETKPPSLPSSKLRKAKAAGLMTPLRGKTPEEKERILRGLAQLGLPLPEAKTASDKKLTEKVRAELGLPPEPKSPSMKERHEKASNVGILFPLEGLSNAEKEKMLKAQNNLGLALPEGRTPSEKSLIAKIKGESKRPAKIPIDKLKKSKAAGLLTPLEGKTAAQKEKILRGLAELGIQLPEAKSASEKKLTDKVRAELGLPPEPKTPSMKERHQKAAAAGVLVPLEGLSPSEKEKVLKTQADLGLSLPEGRTPSEKELIAKVKALSKGPAKLPSDKLRKAKEGGLLTPLEGKSAAQKEKILRSLAELGIPLPEAKTASEKRLTDKVRAELGLPPEPKTPSMKERHEKASASGVLVPLEGLSPAEKEKVLTAQADLGLPLPEGRTPSEKALIAKVKAQSKRLGKLPSEKTPKAKEAGLLTPLEGKSATQKEKILRGLAERGIPLPEAKTASEKKLTDKVRAELGLPPEPKIPSMKEKHEKAAAAGVLVPLEGLKPAEKEKVLQAQADLGLPLPEGRTPSEKELIGKVTAQSKRPRKISSAKLRKAKTTGLLTPIEGKTAAEKEKIVRGLAELGMPIPEAKTASEKKLVDRVRTELGLPPEPKTPSMKEKHEKAAAAGALLPLEGLSKAKKEKVLKTQADLGLPLPEGRTPSEKELIAKVKAESKRLAKIPSEKLRKAKAEGLLTPLAGKSPSVREKILRGLAKLGIPLPEGQTPSLKKLTDKVRAELGLPPEPKTPSMKERHEKAAVAGVLIPLEGLSPAEKEKVLRAQQDYGLPLPEGRTPSEKALIAKIKAEKEPKIPSEKLRKAKAAGLITPLEGKPAAEKEKIIKGLAEAGLPLPEGKTTSEKSMLKRIRTELGIAPPAKTPSEKAIVREAKAEGLLTPLAGKTKAEKEKIIKGLAEAGLPIPVGKTPSEKALVKRIRTEAGLPPMATASEKLGIIKKRSKKIGVMSTKKVAKGISREEIEEIQKTTKCDRACGCDKKKIRFKHSYIKIRVTSPDISSFCSCPDECIPGVKGGAFIDNEGIKVTVGSVVGIPSYTGEHYSTTHATSDDWTANRSTYLKDKIIKTLFDKTEKYDLSPKINYEDLGYEQNLSDDAANYILNSTSTDESRNSVLTLQFHVPCTDTESEKNYLYCEGRAGEYNKRFETVKRFYSSGIFYPEAVSNDYKIMESSSNSSFESVMVIKSETSLSLTTNSSESLDTISVMSFTDSSVTSNSSHYFGYQLSDDLYSHSSIEEERSINRIDYDTNATITSLSNHLLHESVPFTSHANNRTRKTIDARKQQEYLVLRMSQTQFRNIHKNQCKNRHHSKTKEPIVVINHLNKNRDVKALVDELLAKKEFSDASSIFVVVPSDDNDTGNSSDGRNSTICIQMSENLSKWKNSISINPDKTRPKISSISHGVKISAKGKKYLLQELPATVLSFHNKETMFDSKNQPEQDNTNKDNTKDNVKEKAKDNVKEKEDGTTKAKENTRDNSKENTKNDDESKNKLCQATIQSETVQVVEHRCQVVSMDTTADRPCCCSSTKAQPTTYSSNEGYLAANVMSTQINPLLVKQAIDLDQPASFLSMDMTRAPEALYRIPQYTTRGHPLEKTFQESTIPPSLELLLLQKCQCSPEKLRELLEEVVKNGKKANVTSVGVGAPKHRPPPNTPKEKRGKCAACLQAPVSVEDEDTCPCAELNKPPPKSVCPCTVNDPPDSEAEPDLKSGEISSSSSPCPTGPCGEAAGILPSPTSLDNIAKKRVQQKNTEKIKHKKKVKKANPDKNTTKMDSGKKGDKDDLKSLALSDQPDRKPQESPHCPETCLNNPRHLMQRLGLRNYAGRKGHHKEHAGGRHSPVEPPEGQPHTGQHQAGQARAKSGGHAGHQAAQPGAIAQIEAGETYKQVHNKQARFNNSTVGTTTESKYICECPAVSGKKKKKIACECPVLAPQPEQVAMNNEFNWLDDAEINKMKSGLTETTSGFKMNKKKRRPPEPEQEFSIEDAIRYYASLKPDLFRDIVEEQEKKRQLQGSDLNSREDKNAKRKKSKVDCKCPHDPVLPASRSAPSLPSDTERMQSDVSQDEDGQFRGLKFKMGGKGSGSPGLAGVCCFDMLQESFTAW